MANDLAGARTSMVISFLSDFGHADPYVGICHGVMLRYAPQARIIDICHEIPPGDIRTGAAMLAQAAPYLPAGVVVGVVDPGVGSHRRAVVVAAGDSVLVGPDNGLLLWAADALGGVAAAYEVTNRDLMLTPVSRTFHGRDVFSPVGARLAGQLPPPAVGSALDPQELVRLPEPLVRSGDGTLELEVLTIDRYGNLQTAAPASLLREVLGRVEPGVELLITCRGADAIGRYGETFGSVGPGELVVYADSAGLLAIAVNGGRAQDRLGASAGSLLRLQVASPDRGTPRR